MRGRLRGETRVQKQGQLVFRQKTWDGGENSDEPASEIDENEVALLENAIAFPNYVEGRGGSKRYSDTALPGTGAVWTLHQHEASKKWVLHRGSGVYVADAAMSSWTPVTEYAHGSQTAMESGDASNQISAASFYGASASNTNAGVLYWSLTNSTGTRTLSVYKDSLKTQLVAEGSRSGDGHVALAQKNNSGLFGSATLAYSTDDVDSGNTFTLAIGSSLAGAAVLSNAQSNIQDFGDHVIIGSDATQLPNMVVLINLADNRGYPLNSYGPVYSIQGSGSQAAPTPYGYRYLYTFSRILNGSGVGDPSKTRIDGNLVQETGAVRPDPTGNDIPIDYGEFWLEDPISSDDPNILTFNTHTDIVSTFMPGHFTHLSLYRTLDIGSSGVDPVNGQGNNPEIYVWVGDFPLGAGDIEDEKSDEELRAAFSKGFGLKSRFFEPIPNGDVLVVEPNFLLVGRRGQATIPYCQIAGDYKVFAGYHRRDIQFLKLDDGLQAMRSAEGITTILCGKKTYISSQNSYFNAEYIESVFVRNHLDVASEDIGVVDWGSISPIDSGRFVARCSDHSIRVWSGGSWGQDISSRVVNKIVRKMLIGSVGGYFAGAYYLWYRTDSSQTYNNLCLRYGFGRDNGFGWSRMTGADWVRPPLNVGCRTIIDANSIRRLLVLDAPDSAFYWIETFDGYTGSGLTKVYIDKVTTAGVAGSAIPGKVRLREYVGQEENHTLFHQETYASLRSSQVGGFLSGFAASMAGYADGAATPVETVAELIEKGDWQFWTSVTGKRIQIELNFATSGWQLVKVKSLVQAQDKAAIGKGPASTAEASIQADLAGTNLKHWLTRPKNLLNRATGRSYTLTGTAPTNVTGPDGKSYALSFVTGASYSIADTTVYGDFSIILWIKEVTTGNRLLLIDGADAFYVALTNNTTLDVNGAGNVTLATVASGWHQLGIVRAGSTVLVYQNGVLRGTVTLATARGGASLTLNPDAVAMQLYELRALNTVLSAEAVLYHHTDVGSNAGAKVLPLV